MFYTLQDTSSKTDNVHNVSTYADSEHNLGEKIYRFTCLGALQACFNKPSKATVLKLCSSVPQVENQVHKVRPRPLEQSLRTKGAQSVLDCWLKRTTV